VRVETLDHVALWVSHRDRLAEVLVADYGMHVIERTDSFTLVGADARRGKLTLFAAEGEREPGVLARVGLVVPGGDGTRRTLPEGLVVESVDAAGEAYDLHHVAFTVPDPDRTHRGLAALGLVPEGEVLRAGQALVVLERGEPGPPERPLLNHLAVLVESAREHIDEARERGLDVAKVVDAENTLAVFVNGPDGIQIEYVEHKECFSLV
jgi:catechol 2,3-dioxygenase-like lactoylglutathione lyase family enzyme